MELLDSFITSIPSLESSIIQDVEEYFKWALGREGDGFKPDTTDDVAIRTYLLDCQLQGTTRSKLNRIRSSLEYFYRWLKVNDLVEQNPFEKFDLKKPFLTQKQIHFKHNAFTGQSEEGEIVRLRALNRLAESTNRASDVQSILNGTLETLLGEMDLHTAWVSLKYDGGFLHQNIDPPEHGFVLGAAHNLPPSLEQSNRYYLTRPPACNCQKLLNAGRLKRGVNIVECSRLQEANMTGRESNELMFHASVPIICNDQAMGLMNFAAKDWQLFSASDLQFLTAGARQVGTALERARLYDQIRTQHTHLAHELDMARKVQVSMLPEKMPAIPGYSLAAFWKPAFETSGDYYNVFKLPGGRWGFIIADVSDKGAPAALYMAMAHGLIRERVEKETSPAALLGQVNRALCEQDIKTNFITSFYAILDPVHARIKYSLAGHPPPLLRTASGEVQVLAGKGAALGIIPDAQYKDMDLTLAPGQSLVAYTDGLTDANNQLRETYELDHLKKAVNLAPATATGMLKHLQNTIDDWIKETPNFDDITLLVISRKPRKASILQ